MLFVHSFKISFFSISISHQNSLLGALLLAAVAVSTAHAYCYDAQVAQDQHFDDSFVCKENIPYPAQAPGDYAYQCVCPSPRKRVERIYLNNDVCFVVYPEKQDVQYAQCGGHCSFDYGTRIATSTRGYFCVYQSYVQRQFLVWCPNLAAQAGKVVPAPQQVNGHQLYGRFERVTQNLPTLCSCRGYFCDNHAVHGGPGGIHSQIGGVPAIH
ncbi:hypothetical protein BaRGS_00008640 [Batillaria attramentaria]|uniref:Secreted protein n=1 Tax=Batillaria attramentaria TaxID=370345 RepID=A0ABD0LKY3_9CAEN